MVRLTAVALFAVGVLLAVAAPADAGTPRSQLEGSIERVLAILEASRVSPDAAGSRAAIRPVVEAMFDFAEMARRALGVHWRERTDEERREFVGVFTEILERSYLSRIESYTGEKVVFGAESVDDSRATVRTSIVTKRGAEVPVDYHMLRRGDRWVVYDVVIEGISLVANYRSQFNAIIARSSYAGLVERVRAKVEQPAARPRERKR